MKLQSNKQVANNVIVEGTSASVTYPMGDFASISAVEACAKQIKTMAIASIIA